MNIYIQRFSSVCPKNRRRVEYLLRIESKQTIMVEELQEFVRTISDGYHEEIADELHEKFGGAQTLDADHHGTEIRTIRP